MLMTASFGREARAYRDLRFEEGGLMVSRNFIRQLEGYGLTTATILYRLTDHPKLLQTLISQE